MLRTWTYERTFSNELVFTKGLPSKQVGDNPYLKFMIPSSPYFLFLSFHLLSIP